MILIGHPWIESKKFHKVFSTEEIKKTSSKEVIVLEPLIDSRELAYLCQKNTIAFAITVNSLKEAIFANALSANYMICEESKAVTIQSIAEKYLFDTRILVLINDEKEITKIAHFGIDGVIFPEAFC